MTDMTSVAQYFANAIQIGHLTDEQLEIVEEIFKDFK
jgi:hypothetical protein